MKFCQPHHDAMVKELDVLGLSTFVNTDDLNRIQNNVAHAYVDGVTIDNFDPYGLAAWLLQQRVLTLFGAEAIGLILPDDLDLNAEHCPVCFLDAHCVSGCADHYRLITIVAQRQLVLWQNLIAS